MRWKIIITVAMFKHHQDKILFLSLLDANREGKMELDLKIITEFLLQAILMTANYQPSNYPFRTTKILNLFFQGENQ